MKESKEVGKAVWPPVLLPQSYPGLNENIEVDVAIIGGGITGITSAYLLAEAGKKVAVLEAFRIGKGTTGSSTGNLYAPVDEQLQTIESKHGAKVLKEVVAGRVAAMDFIEQKVQQYHIECEFQRVPFYLFTTPDSSSQNQKIAKEYQSASKCGLAVSEDPYGPFPFAYDKMVAIAGQAQFNPLKYVQHLAKAANGNCHIFENTQVTDVEEKSAYCIVTTKKGTVKALQVIMATHTPKGIYSVHTMMEPYREYALAAKLKQPLPEPGIYWHQQESQHYSIRPFRTGDEEYLIVLGEAHKVGHKEANKDNVRKIENYLHRNFQVESIAYSWAAQNYKPADTLPFIGKSALENKKFIATGFAADGLIYGTLSALILTDLINGRENKWAETFSPTRFTPAASAGKVMKENMDVASHLVKDYLFYNRSDKLKDIPSGKGRTVKVDNERLAVFRDEEGKLHMVSGICPHMGCVVHWNNAERSWDCPCHGSRFSVDGKVLEGPAYTGLTQPKNTPQKDQ